MNIFLPSTNIAMSEFGMLNAHFSTFPKPPQIASQTWITPWRGRESEFFDIEFLMSLSHAFQQKPCRTAPKSGIFEIVSLTGRLSDIEEFIFFGFAKARASEFPCLVRSLQGFSGCFSKMFFFGSFPKLCG